MYKNLTGDLKMGIATELRGIAAAVEVGGVSIDSAADAIRRAAAEIERLNGSDFQEDLVTQLLERGGFGTLQLNANPHGLPRMRFVMPEDAHPVSAAKIHGAIIVKH